MRTGQAVGCEKPAARGGEANLPDFCGAAPFSRRK
jgi:hypothetical protein